MNGVNYPLPLFFFVFYVIKIEQLLELLNNIKLQKTDMI